jgi:hypothetical protein
VVGGPLFCCLCYPDFDVYVTASSTLLVVSVSVGRRIATGLGVCFAMVFCMGKGGRGRGGGR